MKPVQFQLASARAMGATMAGTFQMLFNQAVTMGLTDVLGATGARAAFFHLGLSDSSDAKKVHEGLVHFFGSGTQALEASILRELYSRLGSRFDPGVSMTFSGFVNEARKLHSRATGGTI